MMRTLKSGLTIGMLVAAMALAGCGDNDNGHGNENGNDNGGPNPTRTATPGGVRTATPTTAATPGPTATGGGGGTIQAVTFNVSSSTPVQGFRLNVAYPTAKGSFQGSADSVSCTSAIAGAQFIPNDQDNGNLVLLIANATNITLPGTITCQFEATSTLAASDLTITVAEVVINGASGDISVLTATASL